MRLTIGIFVQIQFRQIGSAQRFASHWVDFELFQVGYDVNQIENVAIFVAIGILIRL